MLRSLLLLSLLPALALAQFLPRKTTINQTINLSTDWTADTITANVFDGGYLNITGAAAIGDDLSVGGEFTCTENAAFTAGISAASVAADDIQAGGVDAGTLNVTGTITHNGGSDGWLRVFNSAGVAFVNESGTAGIWFTSDNTGEIYYSDPYQPGDLYFQGYAKPEEGNVFYWLADQSDGGRPSFAFGSEFPAYAYVAFEPVAVTTRVDAGFEYDVSVAGALSSGSFATSGAASVNGLFEFDLADGGTFNASGLVYALGFQAGTSGVQPAATGSPIRFYLVTTHAALDLASVGDGDCSALTTETVTGAAPGDACLVASDIALEAGGFLTCAVTNTDEAKWQLCNNSGGAIDHAEDTFTIRVIQ